MGNLKEVEVDNKTEEESTESNTRGSDLGDLDYNPKNDEMFDDDEHILEDVHVSMNDFNVNLYPRHDLSIPDVKGALFNA